MNAEHWAYPSSLLAGRRAGAAQTIDHPGGEMLSTHPEYETYHRLNRHLLRSPRSVRSPVPAGKSHSGEYCVPHYARAQLSRPGDCLWIVEAFQSWEVTS